MEQDVLAAPLAAAAEDLEVIGLAFDPLGVGGMCGR